MDMFIVGIFMQACMPYNIIFIKHSTSKKLWQFRFYKLIRLFIVPTILFAKIFPERYHTIPNTTFCCSQHLFQFFLLLVIEKSILVKCTTRFLVVSNIFSKIFWEFIVCTSVNITHIVI